MVNQTSLDWLCLQAPFIIVVTKSMPPLVGKVCLCGVIKEVAVLTRLILPKLMSLSSSRYVGAPSTTPDISLSRIPRYGTEGGVAFFMAARSSLNRPSVLLNWTS